MSAPPKLAQRFTERHIVFRIGDAAGRFVIADTTGAGLNPGRWNTSRSPVLYTSAYFSTALLEKLVHSGRVGVPPNQYYIEGNIPAGCSYERPNLDHVSMRGWDDPLPLVPGSAPTVSQRFAEDWYMQGRSLCLIVPSIVARRDHNVIINTQHPEYNQVSWAQLHIPVHWDDRLFAQPTNSTSSGPIPATP